MLLPRRFVLLLLCFLYPFYGFAQDGFPVAAGSGLLPEDAAAAMTMPEGFQAKLFAGEPDVHQPIAFTIDERGRLWVVENYSYPDWSPYGRDRILILEDTDGDGSFDESTVFFDQLNFATAIAVGHGGVWVGTAPYLIFIPDKNRDDIPDGPPQVVLDGWGHQDTHETLNSFVWGPDGWLYGNQGIFTHSNVGAPGARDDERTPLNACVWRYHPTKKIFEVFAEGISNQWGLDFNDTGDAFVTACVIPHLYHVIQAGHYQRQAGQHFNPYTYGDLQNIGDHLHYDNGVSWVDSRFGAGGTDAAGGGHAHAGTLIYLGDNFPAEYRGSLLTHNILGNRINRDTLAPVGSGYIGSHAPDFMKANDGWFRGLRLETGPDGSLFNSDWYDPRACHQQRPHDRTNGRIYKISYGTPDPVLVDLAALSSAELVALQLHPNEWHVRRARLILQERGPDPAVHDALREIIRTNPDVTRQLRALWTLHVTRGLNSTLALELLRSPAAYVRGWTVQLMTEDRNPAPRVRAAFVELATNDASPIVRRFLASAAQRIAPADRWDIVAALLTHGEDADDANLPLLYWYAAEPLVALDPTRAMALATASPLASLRPFFLRRQAEAAATASAAGQADDSSGLANLVQTLGATDDTTWQHEVLSSLLAATAGRTDLDAPEGWADTYRKLNTSPDLDLIAQADTLAARFGDKGIYWAKRRVAGDAFAPLPARQAALEIVLQRRNFQMAPFYQELLTEPGLRLQALRGLAPYEVPGTPEAIFAAYPTFEPDEKRLALSILAQRETYARALSTAIASGTIPASDLDAGLVRQLRLRNDSEIDQVLTTHWGVMQESSEYAQAEIDRWKTILTPQRIDSADTANGYRIFAETCASCHVLFDEGADLGPELTGSNRKDIDYLLANIVDPNGTIGRDYLLTIVETHDGRSAAGIVKRETPTGVTLANAAETVTFARADIKAVNRLEVSLMPPGLLEGLAEPEVVDLVAYLNALGPGAQP
ncbi:PVC-type heme-binding CxxCH protein [Synoicihabitans lomoniglobus]|uniref:C-type cytochrome n=1 Tax=Synoicihabitans lomoniglobus TaxID=2909285 RepID=A0AAE9ZS03_9BACT|nr:c-type cytochrome [Opitutaceae bacterium LMO-M01]WED63166.1 c-type cytochrome [Opitutaceae bacterium LMO-M01]